MCFSQGTSPFASVARGLAPDWFKMTVAYVVRRRKSSPVGHAREHTEIGVSIDNVTGGFVMENVCVRSRFGRLF